MKCQRSVVDHQEGARINLLEVIINHDLLDDGGQVIGVPTLDQTSQYHLVYTMMMTVGAKGGRMVDPHLVRTRHHDEVPGHSNLIHR